MANDINRIRRDTIAEIRRQLDIAARSVAQRLAREGDTLNRQRLTALQADIARQIDVFSAAAKSAATTASAAAVRAGIADVVTPLAQAGINLTPRINPQALTAMRLSMTHLIGDVSTLTKNRINTQLAQVLIGTQPLSAAVTRVQQLLGSARNRAQTIVYTELGRINSAATQAGMEDAAKRLPGMKKRWVQSGKKHPREQHQRAHGQLVDVDKPFEVAGEKLMYPRDPKGSARNTINCGCRHIPVVDGSSWGKSTAKIDMDTRGAPVTMQRDADAPTPAVTVTQSQAMPAAPSVMHAATPPVRIEAWERRSMHGLPDMLTAALYPLERDLAQRPLEWAFVLDSAGRTVFQQMGDATSVRLEGLSISVARGQLLTHNHPTGAPPSFHDVLTAAGYSLGELRAVSVSDRHRIRPPTGGWNLMAILDQEDDLRRYARSVRDRLRQAGTPESEYDRRISLALLEELARRGLIRYEAYAR